MARGGGQRAPGLAQWGLLSSPGDGRTGSWQGDEPPEAALRGLGGGSDSIRHQDESSATSHAPGIGLRSSSLGFAEISAGEAGSLCLLVFAAFVIEF